jgi:hypothetical protein
MLKVQRRIEKLEKALGVSDRPLHVDSTILFIDSDGAVTSMLRFKKGRQEWITDPAEIARAE